MSPQFPWEICSQNFFVRYVYLLERWRLRELLDPEVY